MITFFACLGVVALVAGLLAAGLLATIVIGVLFNR
jgi:hypothetical protein